MLNLQSNCTVMSRTVSADTRVSSPTTMFFSDDDSDFSAVDEPYHRRSVLLALSCSIRAPHQLATSAMPFCSCGATVRSVIIKISHLVSFI